MLTRSNPAISLLSVQFQGQINKVGAGASEHSRIIRIFLPVSLYIGVHAYRETYIVDNKFPRKSSPCFTSPCFTVQVHVLQVHVLQVHVLQVHVLQVQSMVYKSSPIQSPVHVLQHAVRTNWRPTENVAYYNITLLAGGNAGNFISRALHFIDLDQVRLSSVRIAKQRDRARREAASSPSL
jgi:hypothetical protein